MIVKTALASLILISTTSLAFADSIVGVIVAYDRKAELLVLEDKTIWSLEGSEAVVPADLAAGEKVEIDFETAGDDGITKIDAVKRVSP